MKTLALTPTEFMELMNSLADEYSEDINTPESVEETATEDEDELSLIEQVIENFLKECISSKRLPTLAEAEVVKILDDILVKYED